MPTQGGRHGTRLCQLPEPPPRLLGAAGTLRQMLPHPLHAAGVGGSMNKAAGLVVMFSGLEPLLSNSLTPCTSAAIRASSLNPGVPRYRPTVAVAAAKYGWSTSRPDSITSPAPLKQV